MSDDCVTWESTNGCFVELSEKKIAPKNRLLSAAELAAFHNENQTIADKHDAEKKKVFNHTENDGYTPQEPAPSH